MKALRTAVPALAAVGMLALAAPAHASVHGSKNGCGLLKKADVEEAIGKDVKKAPKPAGPPEAKVCGYKVVGETGQAVNLWVEEGSSAAFSFKQAKQVFEENVEKVSGFGKKAFYVSGGLNTLYVLRGDTLAYVQYLWFGAVDDDEVQAAAADMMKAVLERV